MYIITNLELPCNTVLQSDFLLNIMRGIFPFIPSDQCFTLYHPALFWKTDFLWIPSVGSLTLLLPVGF